MWTVTYTHKKALALKSPVLIEGLPGIGNVGKVACDFLVEETKAELLCEFSSHTMPNSVFVNEKNLVELPKIEMYYKKRPGKKNDLLFLAGDVQPIDEVSCYSFCEKVLDIFEQFSGGDVITTGGIGLQSIPEEPRIYATATSTQALKEYTKGLEIQPSLYGIVGPVVGVSGILMGLAGKRKSMRSVAYLAETFGHPMYLGLKGAKALVTCISKKLEIPVHIDRMQKEIEELEKESLKKTKQMEHATEITNKKKNLRKMRDQFSSQVNYIG